LPRDPKKSLSDIERDADPEPYGGSGVASLLPIRTVKDFLRFQIARRWRPEPVAARAGDYTVSIRVALNRDGSVSGSDIIEDPRHAGDPAYRALADSARKAVLLASPLTLPDGNYDEVRDFVVDLDPRALPR
jgi:hypothetical protein